MGVCLLAGCEEKEDRRPSEQPASAGIAVQDKPCRLEVDSPADGEVDATFEISYEDGRPVRAAADFGGEDELARCIEFGWEDGALVSKTDYEGGCAGLDDEDAEQAPVGETSTLQAVEGSNLIALTFPDGELVYHYVTAPGDFTFLLTRTSYNVGPQEVGEPEVRDGRLRALELPKPGSAHTVEATYRGGELVRVSEVDPQGEELGYASFHHRDGRLVKVERRLATMNREQREEVELVYDCEDGE